MWWTKRPSSAELDLERRMGRAERNFTALVESYEELAKELQRLQKMKGGPTRRSRSQVEELLPALDRMHEIALVAMGHADLAQQFGLTARQRENEPEVETEWETPTDEPDGMTYE